jgi:hypothetical protein
MFEHDSRSGRLPDLDRRFKCRTLVRMEFVMEAFGLAFFSKPFSAGWGSV